MTMYATCRFFIRLPHVISEIVRRFGQNHALIQILVQVLERHDVLIGLPINELRWIDRGVVRQEIEMNRPDFIDVDVEADDQSDPVLDLDVARGEFRVIFLGFWVIDLDGTAVPIDDQIGR